MLGRLLRIFGPAVGYRIENRRLLGLMYLAGLFQGYAQTQAVNTLPFARITFDLTAADMSRLFAVTRIGALLAVAYAAFSDRWGRRGPFLVAFLTLLVANGITAAAFPTSLYAAFQMMARMGSAAMAMLAAVLVAEQVRWNNRAWAIGLYSAAVALGSGAGLLALPVAHMHDQGWRLLFGASILGLPLYLLLRSKVPESRVFRFTERPLRFTPASRRPLLGTVLAGGPLQPVDQRLLGGRHHLLSRASGERPRQPECRSGQDPADRRDGRRDRILPRRADSRLPRS